MSRQFQIAAASVAGRGHREGIPKNNQDAFQVRQSDDIDVIVFSDGCSEGERPDIGSGYAAKAVSHYLMTKLQAGYALNQQLLEGARRDLLAMVHLMAQKMGPSLSQELNDNFLFTLGGLVVAQGKALFFLIGDGVIVINGEILVIDAGSENKPAYPAYDLTGSTVTDASPELLKFQIIREMPATELEHWLIGSDGINDLLRHEHSNVPGTDEPIGHISQFWTNNKYFNRTGLLRRLNLIATDKTVPTPRGLFIDAGKIVDDITVVIGRNRPSPSEG